MKHQIRGLGGQVVKYLTFMPDCRRSGVRIALGKKKFVCVYLPLSSYKCYVAVYQVSVCIVDYDFWRHWHGDAFSLNYATHTLRNLHCVSKSEPPKHFATATANLHQFKWNFTYTRWPIFLSSTPNFNALICLWDFLSVFACIWLVNRKAMWLHGRQQYHTLLNIRQSPPWWVIQLFVKIVMSCYRIKCIFCDNKNMFCGMWYLSYCYCCTLLKIVCHANRQNWRASCYITKRYDVITASLWLRVTLRPINNKLRKTMKS